MSSRPARAGFSFAMGNWPVIKTFLRCWMLAVFLPAWASSGGGTRAEWYFAVSGDSRDCGDVIMPKIARAIRSNQKSFPVEFYWHLGDLRALFRIDCDIAKLRDPAFQCDPDKRDPGEISAQVKQSYENDAWDDFIRNQVMPFGSIPVLLGIGNHELIDRTRDQFRARFAKWLRQPLLARQLERDKRQGLNDRAGETYFHFVLHGVDFINLDNAGRDDAFSPEQIEWLTRVLGEDARNSSVKTIVAGMHAALPFSIARNHAMDATCSGVCSGRRVYQMLYEAQHAAAAKDEQKRVYVFASHSHYFEENVYDTPELKGRVLPGWIIGTAGAEQYRDVIRYGYLRVAVREDGTLGPQFIEVKKDDLPVLKGPGAAELTDFCYQRNKKPPEDSHQSNCQCGAELN